MEKYQSLIVPDLQVDIANYLTEIIVKRNAERFRVVLPKYEYWRKEYKGKHDELTTRYIAELTQVKKLLKVFSAPVLIKYFKESKIISFRFVKKADMPPIIYDLFLAQIAYISSLKVSVSVLAETENKVEYVASVQPKQNNLLSKGI